MSLKDVINKCINKMKQEKRSIMANSFLILIAVIFLIFGFYIFPICAIEIKIACLLLSPLLYFGMIPFYLYLQDEGDKGQLVEVEDILLNKLRKKQYGRIRRIN